MEIWLTNRARHLQKRMAEYELNQEAPKKYRIDWQAIEAWIMGSKDELWADDLSPTAAGVYNKDEVIGKD